MQLINRADHEDTQHGFFDGGDDAGVADTALPEFAQFRALQGLAGPCAQRRHCELNAMGDSGGWTPHCPRNSKGEPELKRSS